MSDLHINGKYPTPSNDISDAKTVNDNTLPINNSKLANEVYSPTTRTLLLQVPKDVTYLPEFRVLEKQDEAELKGAVDAHHGADATKTVKATSVNGKDIEISSTLPSGDKVDRTFNGFSGKLKDETTIFSDGKVLDTKFDANGKATAVQLTDADMTLYGTFNASGKQTSALLRRPDSSFSVTYDGKGVPISGHEEYLDKKDSLKFKYGVTVPDGSYVTEETGRNGVHKDLWAAKPNSAGSGYQEVDHFSFDPATDKPNAVLRLDQTGAHHFNIDEKTGKETADLYKDAEDTVRNFFTRK